MRILILTLCIIFLESCGQKTKSEIKSSSINEFSETQYNSKTKLNKYIGTYLIKAVHHLGENYKKKPSKGRLQITETGLKLITDLDSLKNFEAKHDKTNLIDIDKGKFVFESKLNELTMLQFDEEKNMISFTKGTLENGFITIFVYIKEK